MWIVPINVPMTGVGYTGMQSWCYFRNWVVITAQRSSQVPRAQWWRWSIVGCLSLPWGESIKTYWEPVRGKWPAQITAGHNYKNILLSESESEPQSLHRPNQAAAETSEAATASSAVLKTRVAGGKSRRSEGESRQTQVAPSQTESSRQREHSVRWSDWSVNIKTNIATSGCK